MPYAAGTSQPTRGPELLSQASSFHLLARRQRKTSEEGGERRERLQTHLVLIASATTKQLMAGKRRRNRALGERKGCSKQGETIYSFPKERGTIYSRSCSCGGLTHCIQLLSHCMRTRNMACFVSPKVLFLKSPQDSHASQEPQAIAKPRVRQTPPPRASREWRWSFPPPCWHSGLQRHRSSHPKDSPVPIIDPCPSRRRQQAGELSSSLGDVVLQSLHGLIPDITAPQTQPGKQRHWDARKASSPKSGKPSAKIRDRLRCVFSHEKQMLKKKPENSRSKNLQGSGNQAGAAGLIPSWKSRP